MSPKRSAKPSARKSANAGARASKGSPMRKIEHASGPNVDGHDAQARAAHNVAGNEVAPPNTPPSPAAPSVVDEGQRS